jgi:mono/diheme cytochrome c family protein
MRTFLIGVVLFGTFISVAVTAGQGQAPAGKAPFERVCATCHGEDAKGNQGPSLVPLNLEYDEFVAQVRNGGSEMKQITKSEMSDEEVKQVFAYLKSLDAR